ncbi:MAG: PSD1 and planctomycete cytochrome C domain-containing protein [Acidobacteria bacterium]|nr:PSD1 and planctomycete cytochrome C domain-containing protein [Acidobacteriota bacterium]
MPGLNQSLKLFAVFLFFLQTYAISLSRQSPSAGQLEYFEKQVRPILMRSCAGCHNAKAKIAGLDLTTAEGFQRGGDSGPLVNKENPVHSRLLKVISYQEELKMPPTGKLKDDEITVLIEWVKMGAPWPPARAETRETSDAKLTNRTPTKEFSEAEKNFWTFLPISHPIPPKVKNTGWVKSPIDAFILQKLEEKKLSPAPPSDKLTLLRRATYDLIGLPPAETEIREFLGDNSPDAFGKVIERLLNSPRYGEKWGRHWLDVARYADSTGNDEDHRYPHAWKYRDYVIEAFNKDLPYDHFVREQIAGDLVPAANAEGVYRRGIIATGFLALGPKALAQQDKKKMLYDVYDEQLDVTTRAFLGLTVTCARCHNHKFDPILTKDYYSMVGIFASTRSFSDPMAFVSVSLNKPLITKSEYDLYLEKKNAHEGRVKRRQLDIGEIVDRAKEKLITENGPRLSAYMLAARGVYHDKGDLKVVADRQKLSEEVLKKWVDYLKKDKVRQHLLEWQNAKLENLNEVAYGYQQRFTDRLVVWHEKLNEWRAKYRQAISENKDLPKKPEFEAGQDRFFQEVYFGREGPFSITPDDRTKFAEEDWQQISQLKKELEELKKQAPPEPEMACAVEDGEVVNQKVFIRGDYHNEGEDAPKGFPSILAAQTRHPAIDSGSGRLQLAEWITQPEHPLTARVMVNRIWQWHFGEGIVRTPDNFGKMGERPTHPELLDFLAHRFIENGWSIKAIHLLIMLSSAYQMSSRVSEASLAADPENRLLSRFNRRRLTVEEMRDGLMAIDGSLDLAMGGTLQTGTGTDGENDNKRLSLNPEKLNRRTVYLPLRRANLPALLNLFDFGDATTASGKRQLTNVATQALFWMNSEFLSERSKKFSQSLLEHKDFSDAERVKLAYLRIVNREATDEELSQAVSYMTRFKLKYSKDSPDAWQSLCRVLMSSNDFIYVD